MARTVHRVLHVALSAMLAHSGQTTASTVQAAEVTVLVTRIDHGDAKRAAFELSGGRRKYDVLQDIDYDLMRQITIPLLRADPNARLQIRINSREIHQEMFGIGAAMTDSSAWVLMKLKGANPRLYRFLMTKLFSPADGAGFSAVRLPMGASDYTAADKYYTYCDEPSRDLSKFSIARDKEFVIPALRDALAQSPSIFIIASPWSAPAWMKTNGNLKGVSREAKAKGASARLKPDCFEIYADYFVRFVEAYRAEGIEIDAVTLQNEPQFDGADYPCMRMNEEDQIELVRLLGPKLAAKGLKTQIFIHDHNWELHPNDVKPIGGDAMMDPFASVAKIFADPVAGKHIAGSAWHCYSGDEAAMRRTYKTLRERFPDKLILGTESSGWGKSRRNWFGDVEWGMKHHWMGGPQAGSQSAIQWNLVLDHKFGPTLRADSEATAMAAVNTDRFDEIVFEREFYAMAQMSRAAPRGARRVGAAVKRGNAEGLDLVAFALPSGQTSLVAFNRLGADKSFQVEHEGAFFAATAPGRSIVTFVWQHGSHNEIGATTKVSDAFVPLPLDRIETPPFVSEPIPRALVRANAARR